MRVDRSIASRMRQMLTHDCVGVKDGFMHALAGDVRNLLRDYFDTDGEASITINQREDGEYDVRIEAKAIRIKQFDTTMDIKRF